MDFLVHLLLEVRSDIRGRLRPGEERRSSGQSLSDTLSALVPQKVELLMRQTLALVKLGEMPQSCDHLELATMAAFKLGSDLRRNEAGEIYDQMLLNWPYEQNVKRLQELFHQDENII